MTDVHNAKFPDPKCRNPLVFPDGTRDPATVFVSEVIDHPNIATLLDIAWWNWSAEKIAANLELIATGDVAALERQSKA